MTWSQLHDLVSTTWLGLNYMTSSQLYDLVSTITTKVSSYSYAISNSDVSPPPETVKVKK